jgi:hypothetical protein
VPRSPLDETVRLLTLRARVRVPFRAPTAPFDSPDVFEALGLHEPAPIDVQMGTTRSARRPAHEIAPFSYASRTSLEWPEANTVRGRLYLLPGRPRHRCASSCTATRRATRDSSTRAPGCC